MKVHGLLLLDKPQGLSSNLALQKARRLFDADKAGHGGTLDPLANGLLPVLFGEACKLAESALQGDKAYEAIVRLGQTTATDDAEGEVLSRQPVDLDTLDARLAVVLPAFRGSIRQVPPIYSALKVGGKALYRHAREGTPVVPAARDVMIHALTLQRRDGVDLLLSIACGKGTYIRSLARDIGAALGCGAYLAGLRRTEVGPFRVADAITLEVLAELAPDARMARLIGLEALVADWSQVDLDADGVRRFRLGQVVPVSAAQVRLVEPRAAPDPDDGRIAVLGPDGMVGLAALAPARQTGQWLVAPSRVIH